MNRKSFIVRCLLAVAAVMFLWKFASAEEIMVAKIRAAKGLLDAKTTFAEIASRFQWECTYVPLSNAAAPPGATHLIQCWGKFQDGKDYQCAEYLNFEGEHVDGVWYESDPEAILSEISTNFDKAMRTRFNQIDGHFDINAYGACVDDRTESS